MTNRIRYDNISIKATVTPEGFIRDRPVITRSGIFLYKDRAGKTIREYRPPDEVFHEDSLATIFGIPVTDAHHGLVSADNVSGIIGSVISTGIRQDNNVVADVVIHQAKRLGKKRQLSLGYNAEVDETPGVTPDGQKYDTKQTQIRYNHLAVVENGRAGNARLRLDDNEAASFSLEDKMADEPKLVMIKLDNGLEYAAAQEVAHAFAKLMTEVTTKKSAIDKIQAELDTIKNQNAEAETALSEVITDEADKSKFKGQLVEMSKFVTGSFKTLPDRIRARSTLEETAKKYSLKFDSKTSDRTLREMIVGKISGPAIKFDGKSDDYVASAYDIAVSTDVDKTIKIGGQRVATSKLDSGEKKFGGAAKARARMVDTIRAGR